MVQNAQKYEPLTFIFDIGGSFESLTHIFGGSYLNVGQESRDFTINPFSLPPTKDKRQFLFSFFSVLIEGGQKYQMNSDEIRKLWDAIDRIYVPRSRTADHLELRTYRWQSKGPATPLDTGRPVRVPLR